MSVIPSEKDWGEYWKDFDQKSAYSSFFGKSNSQMQEAFFKDGNDLMTEIRFMPVIPFRYYILGFRDFILNGKFPPYEASDIATYFLDMVVWVIEESPEKIAPVMQELMPSINFVANNQVKYEADEQIYGSFLDRLNKIQELCTKNSI